MIWCCWNFPFTFLLDVRTKWKFIIINICTLDIRCKSSFENHFPFSYSMILFKQALNSIVTFHFEKPFTAFYSFHFTIIKLKTPFLVEPNCLTEWFDCYLKPQSKNHCVIGLSHVSCLGPNQFESLPSLIYKRKGKKPKRETKWQPKLPNNEEQKTNDKFVNKYLSYWTIIIV